MGTLKESPSDLVIFWETAAQHQIKSWQGWMGAELCPADFQKGEDSWNQNQGKLKHFCHGLEHDDPLTEIQDKVHQGCVANQV